MLYIEVQKYIKELKLKQLEELLALVKFRIAQERAKTQIKEKQIKKINITGEF